MLATNAAMVAAINSGYSVTYRGRNIQAVGDVPSDAQIVADAGLSPETIAAADQITVNAGETRLFDQVLTVNGVLSNYGHAVIQKF
jgi:proline dehydrogenase